MPIRFLTNEDKVLQYDTQTLTDEEKAQARANIGADVPTTLPNPNKLFFSGASTVSYDGSTTQMVEIVGKYGTGTGAEMFNRATEASGAYSHAEGYSTIASGGQSHAEGVTTIASGQGSHAEGYQTNAFGYGAHSEGWSTGQIPSTITKNSTKDEIVDAWNSSKFTLAMKYGSHAEGYSVLAIGNHSHAEGGYSIASGDTSHAEGYKTIASGAYSHAEGYETIASGDNSHVQGKYNIEDSSDTYAHIVGNGKYNARSNAHTLDWNGNAWYQGDVYVGSASGTNKDDGSKKLATESYVDTAIAAIPTPDVPTATSQLTNDSGFLTEVPEQVSFHGITTEGDGSTYTATVAGIDTLVAGASFIMIPNVTSTAVIPKLNVNGLGAKNIRRRVSNSTVTTVASVSANWLYANKPIRMTYDGTYWIADLDRPNAADIYGTVPIASGGTGATDAAAALENLGAAAKEHTHSYLLLKQLQAAMPSTSDWCSIAYGDGKFVAIAMNATTAYSTDGITWTETTLPSDESWSAVVYGGGKFVAIADETDVCAYSTDGITWTASTMPIATDFWAGMCYGDGKFVAIAQGTDACAYSTDGITWTASTMPQSADFTSVCYGDGKFVAVANDSSTCAYSTDGIAWTETALLEDNASIDLDSVAYGNGKFVAVGDRKSVFYSADGITWEETATPNIYIDKVVYGGDKFLAYAAVRGNAAYSTDGITWIDTTIPNESHSYTNVTYGDGKFVFVQMYYTTCMYSTDCINWRTDSYAIEQDGVDVTASVKAALGL